MKICIAHFRVGLTDGVSLQIDERAKILERFGHKVYFISGPSSPIADLRIPYFDYKKNLKIMQIQSNAFSGVVDANIKKLIKDVTADINSQLEDFWRNNRFSLIFVHNIFSLPVCLPASIAFYKFLKKHPEVRAVAVHHDFWWDPPRRKKFRTYNAYIKKIRKVYFPPKLPNLSHTVLSLWEKRMLFNKRQVDSKVITDTLDFEKKTWSKNESNINFLKDCGVNEGETVVLLASRIRRRKGIELGIEFISYFNKLLPDKKAVLLLPNDYSEREKKYVSLLKKKAKKLKIRTLWLQDLVGSEEEKIAGIKKYSLWDTYVYADAVIYPSLWEGFGNQFLEGVFAKKPIIFFEYPIFETDIKPAGFDVINMGKVITHDDKGLAQIKSSGFKKAANELIKLLKDRKKLQNTVEKNFKIGKKKFNTRHQLRDYLSVSSNRYIRTNGIKTIISPLLLSGKLIASGVLVGEAYNFAESIVDEVPEAGLSSEAYFAHVAGRLPRGIRKRFVTLEAVRDFLTSGKSKSPLFIFLGGLAGKTSLSNLVVDHLGINQPIAFDNEKYHITASTENSGVSRKPTYESSQGYVKTVEAMYPHLIEMINRNIFDYKKFKKWCYFWEGIYLSSDIIARLRESNTNIHLLSVFVLPKVGDIRRQYVLRWQEELGVEKLKLKRNIIDKYLNNVGAIRMHIKNNLDPVASFVIESPILEERLMAFYAVLHQKLKDIADKEIPGWVEKIVENPKLIKSYKKFLSSSK